MRIPSRKQAATMSLTLLVTLLIFIASTVVLAKIVVDFVNTRRTGDEAIQSYQGVVDRLLLATNWQEKTQSTRLLQPHYPDELILFFSSGNKPIVFDASTGTRGRYLIFERPVNAECQNTACICYCKYRQAIVGRDEDNDKQGRFFSLKFLETEDEAGFGCNEPVCTSLLYSKETIFASSQGQGSFLSTQSNEKTYFTEAEIEPVYSLPFYSLPEVNAQTGSWKGGYALGGFLSKGKKQNEVQTFQIHFQTFEDYPGVIGVGTYYPPLQLSQANKHYASSTQVVATKNLYTGNTQLSGNTLISYLKSTFAQDVKDQKITSFQKHLTDYFTEVAQQTPAVHAEIQFTLQTGSFLIDLLFNNVSVKQDTIPVQLTVDSLTDRTVRFSEAKLLNNELVVSGEKTYVLTMNGDALLSNTKEADTDENTS